MREKAFLGYTIKGIDEDKIPRGYSANKPNVVYLLLESVDDDDLCVTLDINSELEVSWVESFNQAAPAWIEGIKRGREYPLSGIEYCGHEDYKALKLCDTNCSAIQHWSGGLKELMRQVNQLTSIEILHMKDFRAAAGGVNSRCFTGA